MKIYPALKDVPNPRPLKNEDYIVVTNPGDVRPYLDFLKLNKDKVNSMLDELEDEKITKNLKTAESTSTLPDLITSNNNSVSNPQNKQSKSFKKVAESETDEILKKLNFESENNNDKNLTEVKPSEELDVSSNVKLNVEKKAQLKSSKIDSDVKDKSQKNVAPTEKIFDVIRLHNPRSPSSFFSELRKTSIPYFKDLNEENMSQLSFLKLDSNIGSHLGRSLVSDENVDTFLQDEETSKIESFNNEFEDPEIISNLKKLRLLQKVPDTLKIEDKIRAIKPSNQAKQTYKDEIMDKDNSEHQKLNTELGDNVNKLQKKEKKINPSKLEINELNDGGELLSKGGEVSDIKLSYQNFLEVNPDSTNGDLDSEVSDLQNSQSSDDILNSKSKELLETKFESINDQSDFKAKDAETSQTLDQETTNISSQDILLNKEFKDLQGLQDAPDTLNVDSNVATDMNLNQLNKKYTDVIMEKDNIAQQEDNNKLDQIVQSLQKVITRKHEASKIALQDQIPMNMDGNTELDDTKELNKSPNKTSTYFEYDALDPNSLEAKLRARMAQTTQLLNEKDRQAEALNTQNEQVSDEESLTDKDSQTSVKSAVKVGEDANQTISHDQSNQDNVASAADIAANMSSNECSVGQSSPKVKSIQQDITDVEGAIIPDNEKMSAADRAADMSSNECSIQDDDSKKTNDSDQSIEDHSSADAKSKELANSSKKQGSEQKFTQNDVSVDGDDKSYSISNAFLSTKTPTKSEEPGLGLDYSLRYAINGYPEEFSGFLTPDEKKEEEEDVECSSPTGRSEKIGVIKVSVDQAEETTQTQNSDEATNNEDEQNSQKDQDEQVDQNTEKNDESEAGQESQNDSSSNKNVDSVDLEEVQVTIMKS